MDKKTDLGPLQLVTDAARTVQGPLADRVSALIEQTRTVVAALTNAALTLMNWHIGRMIDVEVLEEEHARYDRKIVASLEPQSTREYGRGVPLGLILCTETLAARLPSVPTSGRVRVGRRRSPELRSIGVA